MSRLHDMGGRFGDGLIPLPRDTENEVTNFEPTLSINGMQRHGRLLLLLEL